MATLAGCPDSRTDSGLGNNGSEIATADAQGFDAVRDEIVGIAAPFPADQTANANTNGTRAHPHDWLLADTDLQASEVPVAIGTATFANGLVFDSRVYTALDDVAPVMATDCAAPGMQHMAVVRDFRLGL